MAKHHWIAQRLGGVTTTFLFESVNEGSGGDWLAAMDAHRDAA